MSFSTITLVTSSMPKYVPLSDLEEEKIESGGGLAKATRRDREIIYKQFVSWVSDQPEENRGISLYEDADLEGFVWTLFFTMRVAPKVCLIRWMLKVIDKSIFKYYIWLYLGEVC